MRSVMFVFALLLAHPAAALAQLPEWLRPGARLRLTTDAARDPVVGTMVRFDADSVSLRVAGSADVVTIPSGSVSRADVSRERGTLAGKGAILGLWVGGGFGVAAILSDGDVGNKGLGALVFGTVFGLLGAGVGGLIGATVHRDVWEPLSLHDARLSVVPASGRVRVGLSFRL